MLCSAGDAHREWPKNAGMDSVARVEKIRNANGDMTTHQLRDKLQRAMQKHAAVFRTQDTLAEGCVKLDEIAQDIHRLKITVRPHLLAPASDRGLVTIFAGNLFGA